MKTVLAISAAVLITRYAIRKTESLELEIDYLRGELITQTDKAYRDGWSDALSYPLIVKARYEEHFKMR